MTDRELLEKAAKAADVFLTPERLSAVLPSWEWDADFEPRHVEGGGMSGTVLVYSYSGELSGTTREEWNPLEDDGDALRLAVRLKLNIAQGDFSAGVNDEGEVDEAALVRSEDERLLVVRRLIVRAAASLAGG